MSFCDPAYTGLSAPQSISVVGAHGGVFLRGLGIDQELREVFGSLQSMDAVYPMATQIRMLLDMFVVGEHRVFGLESS
jgi:hypothetical protein